MGSIFIKEWKKKHSCTLSNTPVDNIVKVGVISTLMILEVIISGDLYVDNVSDGAYPIFTSFDN